MRLATFIPAGGGGARAAEVRGETLVEFEHGTVLDRLTSGDRTPASGPHHALSAVTLLEPIPRPRAIFCVGLNYVSHQKETGHEPDPFPMIFSKLPSSSAPPAGPVRRPAVVEELDYEGELVLVMGPNAAVAGYAVADDVSARDLQRRESQWVRAKGFDSSCPWGPWITTVDEIGEVTSLTLRTWVNGELRQEAPTADLIFGPGALVDFIGETCTLEPGDLILTGTPAGVGALTNPPTLLQPGDVVRIEIGGLGAIEHRIEDAAPPVGTGVS